MVSVTLPTGIRIDGVSEETLRAILSGVEDGVHYNSATQGKLKISQMATPHLRNAIAKNLRESLAATRSFETSKFLDYLDRGIGAESVTTIAMIAELATRD